MPYISQHDRFLMAQGDCPPTTAGELNYAITGLILEYMDNWGHKYQHINDVIGALEGAKLEFYRRFAAPYEDTKIAENGDVY
jgi:hypothetical protein